MKEKTPLQAFRVRTCYTMHQDCARGKALLAPLLPLDDALILVQQGRIQWIGAYCPKALPAGLDARHVQDLGDGIMVPAVINAHTHTQLAHMAGKTLWGEGFVPWLTSLIPLLAEPYDKNAIEQSVQAMKRAGTGYFADYGHGGLHLVARAAQEQGLQGLFLGEWIGFQDRWEDTEHAESLAHLPPRTRAIYAELPEQRQEFCIPCAHALYSTAPATVQAIHAWCSGQSKAHKRPFVMHFAEFAEEVEALVHGAGALVNLFKGKVLPENWRAPGLHPFDYAQKLGLLTENTLAIHAVHCDAKQVQGLGQAGLSVCLCPRSNAYLQVGTAPVELYLQSMVNLCLGTDGLSSNTSLNVWEEAVYLQQHFSVPGKALLRMLTVNGAKALGMHSLQNTNFLGSLAVGGAAQWAFVPHDLQI